MDSTTERILSRIDRLGDSPEALRRIRELEQDLDQYRFQIICDKLDKIRQEMKDAKTKRSLKELAGPWLPLASLLALLAAQVPLKDVVLIGAKMLLK